jgi:hypothetical protein
MGDSNHTGIDGNAANPRTPARGPVLASARPSALRRNIIVDSRPAMFSLFGWSPSLRRLLRGTTLPCGCSVGVYETFSGEVVRVVDACAASCPNSIHELDAVLMAEPVDADAGP